MSFHSLQLNCEQNYSITGSSKAGFATGFYVSGLNIVLDSGIPFQKIAKAVYITHSHTDHTYHLPTIVTARSQPTPVYMPRSAFNPIRNFQSAIIGLSTCQEVGTELNIWEIQKNLPQPHSAGDVFRSVENNNIQVEVIPCHHSCESIGYGFSTIIKKLKAEYLSMDKKDLGRLLKDSRTNGTGDDSYFETVVTPQFLFMGDTDISALLPSPSLSHPPRWTSYSVLIIECTSYDNIVLPPVSLSTPSIPSINLTSSSAKFGVETGEGGAGGRASAEQIPEIPSPSPDLSPENIPASFLSSSAGSRGHIHFNQLFPLILSHPHIQFVLIHSSLKIKKEWLQSFEKYLREIRSVNNVAIWPE